MPSRDSAALAEVIIQQLRRMSDPGRLEGMARFGIDASRALGVDIPTLRQSAKAQKRLPAAERRELAEALWRTGVHEARILASMVDVPQLVSEAQMDAWAGEFTSWDLCDQCCNNLFRKAPAAWGKAAAWAALGQEEPEYTVRAGFVLAACLAVHEKNALDADFEVFWPLVQQGCTDRRNFVKKAVNWALRQLGKRNAAMHARAVALAAEMCAMQAAAARWIGRDALRELESDKVRARLGLGQG